MNLTLCPAHPPFSFNLCAWFLSNFLCAVIQNVYTLAEKFHKLMLSFWSSWLSMKRTKNADRGKRARWESRLFRTCYFVRKRVFAKTATVETYPLKSFFSPMWQGRQQKLAQTTNSKVHAGQNTFEGIVLVVPAFHQNCHWKGFSTHLLVLIRKLQK